MTPNVSRTLADTEKDEILHAIIRAGTICGAAKLLGINRRTIYRKMLRYGIKLKVNQILGELKRQESLSL